MTNRRKLQNILITGGTGFIGSNFIHYLFRQSDFKGNVINVDKLTYAGNLENLKDIQASYEGSRYFFEKVDICQFDRMKKIFFQYDIDTVVHFAAESHVDRSIIGPKEFIQTNIMGTFTLLEIIRQLWKGRNDVLFHHVSTDEVFGSLDNSGYFDVDSPYAPRSPYAASKASSDHLVRAYHYTYDIPMTISNCSNNYGPYQFPEKLIPLMILNMHEEKPLPVYGDGKNIRDWLYVDDHCSAIFFILRIGKTGDTYTVGGDNEWENINLLHFLCEKMAIIKGREKNYYKKLITYVKDRPGHDRRYAIKCSKLKSKLSWKQNISFEEGIINTIKWYLSNEGWVNNILSGEYALWIDKNYIKRTC